jgi:hypothetical protein
MRGNTTPHNERRSTVGSLPTSRLAPHQERAVLAVLRSKAPRRALSPAEAARSPSGRPPLYWSRPA